MKVEKDMTSAVDYGRCRNDSDGLVWQLSRKLRSSVRIFGSSDAWGDWVEIESVENVRLAPDRMTSQAYVLQV